VAVCEAPLVITLTDTGGSGVPGLAADISCTSVGGGGGLGPATTIPGGFDDFEVFDDLAGWTQINPADAEESTAEATNPFTGNDRKAHFDTNGGMWKIVDTTGYYNITIGFYYGMFGMDAGEPYMFDYSTDGGGSWVNVIYDTTTEGWVSLHYNEGNQIDLSALDPAVENNPLFAIRFQQNASAGVDDTTTDDVDVRGQQLTAGGPTVTFSPITDVGGGDYTTDAVADSPGPTTLICIYSGTGGPLTDVLPITFVTPTVANLDPLPGERLGPADDLDPGTPGLQMDVTGTTDAEDGTPVVITVDGTTYGGSVSGGAFSVAVTMNEGIVTLIEEVVASCGSGSVTKTVNVDLTLYAVIVADPSDVNIDTITVGTGGSFDVMVYGAVLVGGVVSSTESLGSYDFSIKHQVVGSPTLQINSINGSGTGNEFNVIDGATSPPSNADSGDGNAANFFYATNDGSTGYTGPMGIDIPLAVLNFTAGGTTGTTTIFIQGVSDYTGNNMTDLDPTPTRLLTVIVQ
jgi:hypothetical protein